MGSLRARLASRTITVAVATMRVCVGRKRRVPIDRRSIAKTPEQSRDTWHSPTFVKREKWVSRSAHSPTFCRRRRRIISTQRSHAHRAASQANTNAQSKRTPRLPRSLTPRSHRPGRRTKRPPPPPRRPAASGARQRAAHVEPTPAPRSAPAAPRLLSCCGRTF